ncbi:hypothetical protein HPP92_006084 [Vanilla planifolia]|uniref:Uncharacterized protein n=1 Tax=Vanilla planifolia TaxID=51239 RepID=A0A835VDS4_VANPL|nr:hypothetical protein HPP92_006084 [Vanilla planifolia]
MTAWHSYLRTVGQPPLLFPNTQPTRNLARDTLVLLASRITRLIKLVKPGLARIMPLPGNLATRFEACTKLDARVSRANPGHGERVAALRGDREGHPEKSRASPRANYQRLGVFWEDQGRCLEPKPTL